MTRVERARRQIEARIHQDAIGATPGSKWRMIVPFLMEHGFAARVVRKRLHLPTPLNTTDREVLEQVIFAHYRTDHRIRTVLFVGSVAVRIPLTINAVTLRRPTSGPSSPAPRNADSVLTNTWWRPSRSWPATFRPTTSTSSSATAFTAGDWTAPSSARPPFHSAIPASEATGTCSSGGTTSRGEIPHRWMRFPALPASANTPSRPWAPGGMSRLRRTATRMTSIRNRRAL
jgi:hypothetical protein